MVLELVLGAILVIAVVVVLAFFVYYNKFTKQSNQCEADWKQIDTLLQQRLDTIPNLLVMAKSIMKQEKALFVGISEAREAAAKAETSGTVSDKINANLQLSGMLLNFRARSEAYPEMKSNQNMAVAMESLSGMEDKIKYGRERYNYSVQDYINAVSLLPGVFFAGIFGFARDKWPYFKAEEAARSGVKAAEILEK